MKKLHESKFAVLELDTDRQVLITCWKDGIGEMYDEVIKEHYILKCELIEEYRPLFILMDSRERHYIYHLEIQKWVGNVGKRVIRELGIKKIAALLPKDTIANISTTQVLDEIEDTQKKNSRAAYFYTKEEAYEWFKK